MANDFQFISPAQTAALEARLEDAEAELATLRAAVVSLETFYDAIRHLDPDSGFGNSVGVHVLKSAGEQGLLSLPIDSGTVGESGTASGDSKADEYSGEQGPDDLSHATAGVSAGDFGI